MHVPTLVAVALALSFAGSALAQDNPAQIELADGKLALKAPESWVRKAPQTRIVEHEFAIPAFQPPVPLTCTLVPGGLSSIPFGASLGGDPACSLLGSAGLRRVALLAAPQLAAVSALTRQHSDVPRPLPQAHILPGAWRCSTARPPRRASRSFVCCCSDRDAAGEYR